MHKKSKGFTLVELLAVIVILAIILAIAIPSITSITTKAKTDSFISNVKMLIKGVEYEVLQTSGISVATLNTNGVAGAGGSAAQTSAFNVDSLSPVQIDVTGAGKFSGCTVSNATLSNIGAASGDGTVSGC